ncbi:MAG TPA: YceH family protein [Pyrinomonadaceae bacterium]|nr:YceH family protein [Pyrinomonadaceae bacterium]
MLLTETEVRVLGSLIEKQITTPEYYPLTLNSLTAACNQKNNRNPVTALDESEVEHALDSLREKNLAYVFHGSTSRVPKFKHVAPEVLQLNPAELAVICVLMLSGHQTMGEIRTRGSRMHDFTGLEEVEQTLHALSTRETDPLVTKLPRQPGQKDARFAHLLCGKPETEMPAESAATPARRTSDAERIAKLEGQVGSLTEKVDQLTDQFEQFKRQFE